jgi:hypothetical protein
MKDKSWILMEWLRSLSCFVITLDIEVCIMLGAAGLFWLAALSSLVIEILFRKNWPSSDLRLGDSLLILISICRHPPFSRRRLRFRLTEPYLGQSYGNLSLSRCFHTYLWARLLHSTRIFAILRGLSAHCAIGMLSPTVTRKSVARVWYLIGVMLRATNHVILRLAWNLVLVKRQQEIGRGITHFRQARHAITDLGHSPSLELSPGIVHIFSFGFFNIRCGRTRFIPLMKRKLLWPKAEMRGPTFLSDRKMGLS